MPNHIYNRITGDRETMDAIRERLKSDDERIDFNRLIRMPEHAPGFYAKGDLGDGDKQANPNGNWYDWSVQFWGTKWGAYGCEGEYADARDSDVAIHLKTAWSAPMPIIFALAAAVPLTWSWEYADEDSGYNFGRINVIDGRVYFGETPEQGTAEARLFSYGVRGIPEDEYAAWERERSAYAPWLSRINTAERNRRVARGSAAQRSATLRTSGNGRTYAKYHGRHEHRVVMEKMLGRALRPGEIVHHRDGDRRNNHPDNLALTDRATHARHHLHGHCID